MEYTNYLYKTAKNWLYPPPPVQLTPLEKLKKLLEAQESEFSTWKVLQQDKNQELQADNQEQRIRSFYFYTKHTSANIVIERICMMYSNLLKNPSFSNFVPITLETSDFSFLSPSPILLKQIVCLEGQIKINTQRIKYSLEVVIVIHPWIEEQLPWIYIVNQDAYKMQPNRQFQQIYRQTLGGVFVLVGSLRQKLMRYKSISSQVSFPNEVIKTNKQTWLNYQSENLQKLMVEIKNLATQYFPFVKRFISWEQEQNLFQENSPIFSAHSFIKQTKNTLLPTIQKLTAYSYSLTSETQHLKNQIKEIKKEIQDKESKKILIDEIIVVEDGNIILELECEIRACQDCMGMIEQYMDEKQGRFLEVVDMYKEFCQKKFEKQYMMTKLIKQKQEQNK